MKTNKAHYLLVGFFAILISLILIFRSEQKILGLMPRDPAISGSSEWLNTRKAVEELLARIRANPDDAKSKLNLALAYIQESRITGNHTYYDKAALQLVGEILRKDKNNFDAVCARATVLLSQHHFSEALTEGNRAVKINPYSPFGYGILTDANVELGNYDRAIVAADKMNAVRPDLRSYSRISYLREIFGDNAGSREAMQHAVEAGVPGMEQTEWCRVYLGKLLEQTGDLPNARLQYMEALSNRQDYAFALAGLGRIERAEGRLQKAISYFRQAKKILRDYSFNEELAGLYCATGRPDVARIELDEALLLLGANAGDESQNIHGHYADRELALVYLKKGDADLALKHAQIEYNRRPLNIDVNQALALVYYQRHEYVQANKYMDVALRTHSKNPVLLYEAGLVKIHTGRSMEGMALMKEAMSINPYLHATLNMEGKELATK